MGIAQDMSRLRAEMDQGAQQRRAELAAIKQEVQQLKLESHAEQNARRLAIQEIAADVRNMLHDFKTDPDHANFGAKLQENVAEMFAGFQLAKEQRNGELNQLRTDIHAYLAEVRADLEAARAAFRGEYAVPFEFEPAAPTRAAAPAPRAAAPAPRTAAPSNDDLERIVGIGPSTKRVLEQAGISSFNQIATSTPERLNTILGDLARFANTEHWIRQAQALN